MLLLFCCCDLVMSRTLTWTALVKCQEHDLSENVSHSVVTTALSLQSLTDTTEVDILID